MVTLKLKGIFKVTAKGKVYYYAWRGGPRLYAEFGTKEFAEEFLAASSPTNGLDRTRFAAWVKLYKASPHKRGGRPYSELADKTRRNWDPFLEDAEQHFGALPIRVFERAGIKRDIRHWRDKWGKTPRMADLGKQALSRVFSFMVAEAALTTNPCSGIENLYENDRSQIIWSDDDLDAFCDVASPELGWAARLAAHTGLRQGDLLSLTWKQVSDLYIERRTSKSRGRRSALIPMTQALRDVLAAIQKRSPLILTNTRGAPWRTGFGASWKAAFNDAGFAGRDLHFHDLRGTAATKFYRAGLTVREIADILAWSEDDVERLIDRYVRRDELMRDRIRKIERVENENRKTGSKTGGGETC